VIAVSLPLPGSICNRLLLLWAIVCLAWLNLEARSVSVVSGLACTAVSLFAIRTLLARVAGRTATLPQMAAGAALFGVCVGLASAIATACLMLFKTALHAHPIPDYSLLQIVGMIERSPAWALAGALFSLGIVLILASLRDPRA
jgi:hypothetical protein